MAKRAVFLAIGVMGAILDLATKAWASRTLAGQRPVDVVPGWLRWQYSENKGIVWGLFPGAGAAGVFAVLSLLAVPVIVAVFWRSAQPGRLFTAALGLILAGTLGNLHDRLVLGAVRDFIDFYVIDYPIFNVADSLICTGVGLLLIESLVTPAAGARGGPATAAGEASDTPRTPAA